MTFEPVDQKPSFPALEEKVLVRWRQRDVFRRSIGQRAGAPVFSVYDGPPTTNGPPGVHHVPTRSFKDVYGRYRTMKGYRVPRQAGWDCHGIPVEIEIEKQLGFSSKRDIEAFGVGAFNDRCRAFVEDAVVEWERLTERIAYWTDLEGAYWTLSPSYIDSVWWSLKELWERDLLYEGFRVVPYCPRCGTTLSDHEVAQGLAPSRDPSVYVRFPLADGPLADEGAALLVWSTTPWMMPANAAVAVAPDARYVLVDAGAHGRLVLAAGRVEAVLGEEARVLREVTPGELHGRAYQAPYDFIPPGPGVRHWRVVLPAGFVDAGEGSGIAHVAPVFSADDLALAEAEGLAFVKPIDDEGRFVEAVRPWAGRFFKDVEPDVVADLDASGLLVRAVELAHMGEFCWRCDTPLVPLARPSWYIATTRVKERMLEINAGVEWHPGHVRAGRYGNWLANNVDWALSRERYWGTPLPFWRCEACAQMTVVGSLAELARLSGRDAGELRHHRPYVDGVTLPCPRCGGTARRLPEVADAWYDAGCLPFARFGYPFVEGSHERFAEEFPASLVGEGLDQTRGLFYVLMAIAALLFDRTCYERVLVFGLVVDAHGKKMSKSRRNVINPWELVEAHGADALRWLLVTGQSHWVENRLSREQVGEMVRRFLLTLWNTHYFFVTYARIDGWDPRAGAPPVADRPVLDRWVLAELAATVRAVDAGYERFDATAAGRRIQQFVDDLSNWYVRRTRARFWAAGDTPDKRAAFATLYECLVTVSRLSAPIVPFVADELHESLVRGVAADAADSVPRTAFPAVRQAAAEPALRRAMAAARRLVELGRRARNQAGVPVRQPLRQALVSLPPADRVAWDEVMPVVADELNVKAVELVDRAQASVSYRVQPEFRTLGPQLGPKAAAAAEALAAAEPGAVVAALRARGEVEVGADGERFTLTAEHVRVVEEPNPEWQGASDGPYAIALDLELDDELRLEGLARELARAVNDVRRDAGVPVEARVTLAIDADEAVARALEAHGDWLAGEVLATRIRRGRVTGGTALRLRGGASATVALERR